jgi:hypothetical protein
MTMLRPHFLSRTFGSFTAAVSLVFLVTAKVLALVNGASSYNSPGTNAVVWMNGCTGALVAPDVVLTAAHCVPIPGGHDEWSLQDGNWHPFPNGVSLDIRFGPDSFQPIFTARATWLNDVPRTLTGGHDDITLLGLDRKVPEHVAIPREVLVEKPPTLNKKSQIYIYGYGDALQQSRFRTGGVATNYQLLSQNYALVDLSSGTTGIGGDSGGPWFLQDVLGPVIGVTQGVGRSMSGNTTYGNGQGEDKPNIGAWLRRTLYHERCYDAGTLHCYREADESLFYQPTIDGTRLDWCRWWGTGCGEPAAQAFCHMHGFPTAQLWERDANIGARTPTQVLETGHHCPYSNCDGFRYIKCTGEHLFVHPQIEGTRLDWCRWWGAGCGEPAAQAFCHTHGFFMAQLWERDANIGARTPTQVLETGQRCLEANCDGFRYIACQ